MQITNIASYLVSPGKNLESPPDVKGTMLPLAGRLYSMLNFVYEKSDSECCIPIRFLMGADGSQNNEARNKIIEFIKNPTFENGKILAEGLRECTTQKPGLALFFIILGNDGKSIKIVLSRFPAEEGVLAEAQEDTLRVEFIERIFMKNAKSYKAALYNDESLEGGFWRGSAIDKQLDETNQQIAYYWIHGFLISDFETTSKQGTKTLAVAIRDASKKATNLEVKQQLIAFTTLSFGLVGQNVSVSEMIERFYLSEDAKDTLLSQLPYKDLANDHFILDADEFSKHVMFTSVELDNGGILMAAPNLFDQCFHKETLNEQLHITRFTTEGKIIDEIIKGRK